jgi:hypothetical protein
MKANLISKSINAKPILKPYFEINYLGNSVKWFASLKISPECHHICDFFTFSKNPTGLSKVAQLPNLVTLSCRRHIVPTIFNWMQKHIFSINPNEMKGSEISLVQFSVWIISLRQFLQGALW